MCQFVTTLKSDLFLVIRFLNFFVIHVVQEYLNEISPTIYGPNKPKTSGKPLIIPDLQPPASYHDKPATLYIGKKAERKYVFEGYCPITMEEGFAENMRI